VTFDIKKRVDRAAKDSGHSQSQEAERLIDQGLLFEELFGEELRSANIAMCAAFAHVGKAAGRDRLGSSQPDKWLADPICYQSALGAAVLAMLERSPDGLLKGGKAFIEWFTDRLKSREASGFVEVSPQGSTRSSK